MKSARHREDYKSLAAQYLDPNSEMYRKVRIVDSYIETGNTLLDIGMGTGELIALEKRKFKRIYGLDLDAQSVEICQARFEKESHITIMKGDMRQLENYFHPSQFDCITALDVLEHIDMESCKKELFTIFNLINNGGKFIFTGPGVFEKARIALGKSPTHIHSHSSLGWKRMITGAGFAVVVVETVEFPITHSVFLRKKLHLFGKCCLIVAEKRPLQENDK